MTLSPAELSAKFTKIFTHPGQTSRDDFQDLRRAIDNGVVTYTDLHPTLDGERFSTVLYLAACDERCLRSARWLESIRPLLPGPRLPPQHDTVAHLRSHSLGLQEELKATGVKLGILPAA